MGTGGAAPEQAVRAYLERLGVGPEPPSAEALARLHRAHVERVPYETVWLHAGQTADIDAASAVARVVSGGGGYCFHLNGAFAALLAELGYDVTRHVGGVHGPAGPAEGDLTNHLVLTVAGLPADDNPTGRWYVDVGLGDALHEPLPLRPGTYQQGPFRLVLAETPGGVGDWHLTHDPQGAFTGMSWRAEPATADAFDARHEWLSTSPDSGFVKVLTVFRRDATGVDVLRGLTRRRIGDGAAEATLTTQADLVEALADIFGIDVAAHADSLWARVSRAHEAWVAAGCP